MADDDCVVVVVDGDGVAVEVGGATGITELADGNEGMLEIWKDVCLLGLWRERRMKVDSGAMAGCEGGTVG